MKTCNVVYRKARSNDDIAAIAKYIYLTDPYIYPTICDSPHEKEWVELIAQCYQRDDNLFSLHSIYVALVDQEIVGICCIIPCGSRLKFSEDLKLGGECSARIAEAVEGYFNPLLDESCDLDGYNVVNLCVDRDFRARGIGRGLLSYCLNACEAESVYLDVVAENATAVYVYQLLGFKIIKEYDGFSGKNKTVKCYQMKHSK